MEVMISRGTGDHLLERQKGDATKLRGKGTPFWPVPVGPKEGEEAQGSLVQGYDAWALIFGRRRCDPPCLRLSEVSERLCMHASIAASVKTGEEESGNAGSRPSR